MRNAKYLVFLIVMFILGSTKGQDARDLENLARGYEQQGNTIQAAAYFNKSGYSYWNNGQADKAVVVFRKALDLYSLTGNNVACITVATNLGFVYSGNNKHSEARKAFMESLRFARKMGNKNEVMNSLINIGNSNIEEQRYNEAIENAKEALAIANELSMLRSIARCNSLLAEANEKLGNSSEAFKYYEAYSLIDKKMKAQEIDEIKSKSEEEVAKANLEKHVTALELKVKKGELKLAQDSLFVAMKMAMQSQFEVEKRNAVIKEKEYQLKLEKQIRLMLVLGIAIALVLVVALVFFIFRKIKDNKILVLQKEEITAQRNKLDFQNKKITDSIEYALRIQQAMLPNLLNVDFDIDALFLPKDIVSGDFYWHYNVTEAKANYHFFAVVDCTGHGVPGAFMSMIGNRLLNEIIATRKVYSPSQALQLINQMLHKELHQDISHNMDGMDISLCRLAAIDKEHYELVFSGAKRPLYWVTANGDAVLIDGDSITIGGIQGSAKKFSEIHKTIRVGDSLILFSDGMIDQPNVFRSRFGSERFLAFIKANITNSASDLLVKLHGSFKEFKQEEEQRDDITVFVIKTEIK